MEAVRPKRDVLHGVAGTAVGVVVTGTLGLVKSLLGTALAIIGLKATGNTVGGISDGLLDLVLGRLGGVRSELLLRLCGDRS